MNLKCIVAVLSLAAPAIVQAQSGDMKGMNMKQDKVAAGTIHQASGKVTKLDQAKGTVTIAHGPVSTMNWPSMTMAFKVKDKALMDKLAKDRKVDFEFKQEGSDYVITAVK